MNTINKTARNLLDVRIILAVLWVAGMLSVYVLSSGVT
jgi:hypothetical protein